MLQFGFAIPENFFCGSLVRDLGKVFVHWALKSSDSSSKNLHFFRYPSLVAALESDIGRYVTRVVLKEFYDAGSWNLPSNRQSYYKLLSSLLNPDWFNYLTNKYECLALVDSIVQQEISAFSLFYERFHRDKFALLNRFKIGSSALVDLIPAGDRHAVGSVLVLEFDNGKKLLYKPQSAASVLALKAIISDFSINHRFNIDVPDTWDCFEYHWQEYVQRIDDAIPSKAYDLGALLALCDSLALRDMHGDNIIYTAESIYIVDAECLAMPVPKGTNGHPGSKGISLSDIGILPSRVRFNGHKEVLDWSPFGSISDGDSIPSWAGHSLIDDGLPTVRLVESCQDHESKDSVKHSGEFDIEMFLKGYADCKKDLNVLDIAKIFKLVGETSPRMVLRSTQFYANCIRRASYPQYMVNMQTQRTALRIWLTKSSFVPTDEMIELEIDSMVKLQIPLFHVSFEDKNMHGISLRSSKEILTAQHEKRLKPGCAEREARLIRQTFAVKFQCLSELPKVADFVGTTQKKIQQAEYKELLTTLFHSIVANAEESERIPYWQNLTKNDEGQLILHSDPFSLYNGGSGVFLALAAANNNLGIVSEYSSWLLESMAQALSGYVYELSSADSPQMGLFTGKSGVLYALLCQAELQNKRELIAAFAKELESKKDFGGHDVISGAAGVLKLITEIKKNYEYEKIIKKSEQMIIDYIYSTRVYDSNGYVAWEESEDWTGGFAHGPFGVAWALAHVSSGGEHAQLIEEALNSHFSLYDKKTNRWRRSAQGELLKMSAWCHGSEGILPAFSLLREFCVSDITDFYLPENEHQREFRIPSEGSLCHGLAGRILNSRLLGIEGDRAEIVMQLYIRQMLQDSVCLSDALMTGRSGVLFSAIATMFPGNLGNPLYCTFPKNWDM